MYCRFCGTKIPDNVKFCPECGANLAPVPSAAPEESAPAAPAAPEIPTPFDPTPYDPAPYSADPFASADVAAAPQRGMKWFKFIIYFQLWAGMLVNLVTAGKYFTGAYYSAFTAETAGSFLGALVMIFINIPYFNNRKHLFVNP